MTTSPTSTRSPQAERHARTRKALTRTADEMTRLLQTGSTKRSAKQKALAIFDYPGILTLAQCYEEYRATRMDARGRKPRFPAAVLLATAALARALGSLPDAIKVLRDEDVWARVQEIWETYEDAAPLPPHPPGRDQVQAIRKTIEDRDGLLAELKETFTAMAVRQAQDHGNLRPGTHPNLSSIDLRHTVFGDGVILKPMTDVVEVWNPVLEKTEYIGSRARVAPPRVQHEVRSQKTDHAGRHGINFVNIHTETPAGLVTLGVQATLGGEQWAALDVLRRIHTNAPGLAHTVVYDGALTGWVIDHLMGALGMDLVQKGRNRPRRGEDPDAQPDDQPEDEPKTARDKRRRERPTDSASLDVHAAAEVLTADFLRQHMKGGRKHPSPQGERRGLELTGRALHGAVERTFRYDALSRMWHSGAPLPVGTSLYPSAKDAAKFELVNSVYEFVTISHTVADGTACSHDLALDDGALFVIDIDEHLGAMVKTARIDCHTARREQHASGYSLVRSYSMPCHHGAFEWTRHWNPDPTHYIAQNPHPSDLPYDKVGRLLRTVPRARAERFSTAVRLRNYSEAFNNWFENLLPRFGRATSLTLVGQELDALLAAVAMNALTWANQHDLAQQTQAA